ncbi:MAG TPA: histidine kinase [Roseiflexaceae bacterium]|nr:histidine kinase [Roseiflexaceae bacterium]
MLREATDVGELDGSLIATTRLVLASSVLFIIVPSDLENLEAFHFLSALYTTYSALLYLFVRHRIKPALANLLNWADIGWAVALVMASDDSSTAFLFLLPILIAAFQWSFASALRITALSAALLVGVGLLKDVGEDLLLTEILLPPTYLLVFGYLLARWGDREMAAKRRLLLLKELTRLSNPRFGIDRTISTVMERLRAFHDAEACLLIVADQGNNQYVLRRAGRFQPERAIEGQLIPAEMAQLLLAPAPDQAIIHLGARQPWQWWLPDAPGYIYTIHDGQPIAVAGEVDEMLVTIVDALSFVSVPLRGSYNTIGRLYLTAARRRAFSPIVVVFLLQVIEQIVPMLDNIRLVDQLASSAAEEERRRLAHDIHDNVIQPYIGFQIGLAAISQKVGAGDSDIADDIAQLMAITDQGISDLRRYIHQLPGSGGRDSILIDAVQRFAATFVETTHIQVQIDATTDLYINDRLAAEVFQIIVEGLNNIRRHTRAANASVGLMCENDSLIVRITNDSADPAAPVRFVPRSIAERAAALGGQVHVEHHGGGTTQIIVEIPL